MKSQVNANAQAEPQRQANGAHRTVLAQPLGVAAFVDNRSETLAQRQLQKGADNSAQATQHDTLRSLMNNGARMVAQRKMHATLFGGEVRQVRRRVKPTLQAKGARVNQAPRGTVQLAVVTNGGAFDTEEYKPHPRGGDSMVGANIHLTFLPNAAVRSTDTKQIGLVQTVKTMKRESKEGDPESQELPTKKNLKLKLPGDPRDPATGVGIDKRDKDNSGLSPVSPVYAEQADYSERAKKIVPTVAPKGGSGEYFGKNWSSETPKVAAELVDRPRTEATATQWWKGEFEVAALMLDGAHENSYLGSVRWGWKFEGENGAAVDPDAITLASPGIPSTTFRKAGERWNAAMKGLPPKEKATVRPSGEGTAEDKEVMADREVRILPELTEAVDVGGLGAAGTEALVARVMRPEAEKGAETKEVKEDKQSVDRTLIEYELARRLTQPGEPTVRSLLTGAPLLLERLVGISGVLDKAAQDKMKEVLTGEVEDLVTSASEPGFSALVTTYVKMWKKKNVTSDQVTAILGQIGYEAKGSGAVDVRKMIVAAFAADDFNIDDI